MASGRDKTQAALDAAQRKKARAEANIAAANADKAELERERLARENAEWEEGKALRQQAAAADALAKEMTNETTRRAWIADMAPDFTKVDSGSIHGADEPVFSAILASRALSDAAAKVAEQLFPDEPVDGHVFLTTDRSLVDRLATYNGVRNQIDVATGLIESTLASVPVSKGGKGAPGGKEDLRDIQMKALGPLPIATAAVGAVAAALPGVLSLFSAKRTLATAEVSPDAYIAMVAVAGALLSRKNPPVVIMDETRVLPAETKIGNAFAKLHKQSLQLTAAIGHSAADGGLDVKEWREEASATLKVVQAVIEALTTADEKTGTNVLTRVASQEVLTDPGLKHIVVITPAASGTTQLINDRPLWLRDTVSIITTAAISFVCVDAQTGYVKNAGVSTGSRQLSGKIGKNIDVDGESAASD